MSPTRIALFVACLAVAAIAGGAALWLNAPSPTPANDLRAIFAANPDRAKAKADADSLRAIAGLAAAVVEYDGKNALNTAGQADTLRADLRAIATGGLSFRDAYPTLPAVLGKFFADRVGDTDGPLDAARRAKWVKAFQELRDAAANVVESL